MIALHVSLLVAAVIFFGVAAAAWRYRYINTRRETLTPLEELPEDSDL